MANSAYYNRGNEVTSLNRAAVMLGLRALKVLALGFTLASELPSKGTSGGFDLQLFWHRSLVNAVAGRSIAAAIRSTKTEEAFLCGLLSQIGQARAREDGARPLQRGGRAGRRVAVGGARARVLGHTSSEVGELAARPVARAGVDRPRRDLRGARRRDSRGGSARVARARRDHRACDPLPATSSSPSDAGRGPEAASTTRQSARSGCTTRPWRGSSRACMTGVLESAEAFAVELPPGHSYQEILNEAHAQLMSVSLNTVIDLEQTASALAELAGENEVLQTRAHDRQADRAREPRRARGRALARGAPAAAERGRGGLARRDDDRHRQVQVGQRPLRPRERRRVLRRSRGRWRASPARPT